MTDFKFKIRWETHCKFCKKLHVIILFSKSSIFKIISDHFQQISSQIITYNIRNIIYVYKEISYFDVFLQNPTQTQFFLKFFEPWTKTQNWIFENPEPEPKSEIKWQILKPRKPNRLSFYSGFASLKIRNFDYRLTRPSLRLWNRADFTEIESYGRINW